MGVIKKLAIFGLPILVAYYYLGCCCGDHFEPETIKGKRVLVTGASSGIGEAVALRYAELGAELVITARRKDLLEKVAAKCKQVGAKKIFPVIADMALPEDRKKVVDVTLKELGGLDFLILNHALMGYSFWKGDMAHLEKMTNVNFFSFADLTSGFLKALETSKGHIGVVSSVAGKSGNAGIASYAASKHALQGFFSSLRQEQRFRKTGVSVTLVVYGPVASEKAIEIMGGVPTTVDMMSHAGSTEEAADVLVKGVSARKYEIFYPLVAKIASPIYRMFPYFMEDLGLSMLQEDAKV